jgi:hypothetical protein
LRKGLVSCLKNNGLITLKKHVDLNHRLIAKIFEEKMNNNMKSPMERLPIKKRHVVSPRAISKFLGP